MPRPSRAFALSLLLPLICLAAAADDGGGRARTMIKSEAFDRDPAWDAVNNHVTPKKSEPVKQDFGYSATAFASGGGGGGAKGEIGGRIQRAARAAYYAESLPAPKTLNDRLTASGTFALTKAGSGGGIHFGWFNSTQPEATGRPVNSLGLDLGTENTGGRLAIFVLNGKNETTGKFVTRFERYRTKEEQAIKRPTPIKADGTRYTWMLSYDPDGAGGNGRVEFIIKSNSPHPDEFEGKPISVDLPPGFKKTGATFDRFGLLNGTKPGGAITVYFGDLTIDGKKVDLSKDPGWTDQGNRETYVPTVNVGAHNFGFSEGTHFAAGASAGEVGGDFWRTTPYAYYGDRVGPLSLQDRLEASGKVILLVGAPDSDMNLGWFSADAKDDPSTTGNFVGAHIGGPTRVGHYFAPWLATAKGIGGKVEKAPVLVPNKPYRFTLAYDPAGNSGNGEVRVTLGDESATLPVKPGVKAQGARLDRFGLFTSTAGGQLVRIYLDDLKYTSALTAK
jgi:hypothetical protein